MMVGKKRGLGRGLDALLPKQPAGSEGAENRTRGPGEVPLEWIQPGQFQPRSYFDDEAIDELAASIRSQGVMQPIVLRPIGENRYEIIAGERRWRAAQRAGLDKIPAVIREADDEAALAMSLIENIQREDLNPLEEAHALQRLIDEFELTHQQVAIAVGRSRSAVTNTLRLVHLVPTVADMLAHGDIEMGHARALLVLDSMAQAEVARTVSARGLSVRQTEALVKRISTTTKDKPADSTARDVDTRRLEENLGMRLGQPVQIRHSKKGKGKVVIDYNTLDELDGILEKLGYEE